MVYFQNVALLQRQGPELYWAPLDPSIKAPSCGLCSAVASGSWIFRWKPCIHFGYKPTVVQKEDPATNSQPTPKVIWPLLGSGVTSDMGLRL